MSIDVKDPVDAIVFNAIAEVCQELNVSAVSSSNLFSLLMNGELAKAVLTKVQKIINKKLDDVSNRLADLKKIWFPGDETVLPCEFLKVIDAESDDSPNKESAKLAKQLFLEESALTMALLNVAAMQRDFGLLDKEADNPE